MKNKLSLLTSRQRNWVTIETGAKGFFLTVYPVLWHWNFKLCEPGIFQNVHNYLKANSEHHHLEVANT